MPKPKDQRARPRENRGTSRERGYTTAWGKAREGYLKAHPHCVMCAKAGKITAATVVDHIIPHRGDMVLFWDKTNWQGLCRTHHSSSKQQEENKGFSSEVDASGWPTDPRHPANRTR